ncbi:hypothetical protein VNO78_15003 [Psophocarpus tetragonolobus]|uniref:Uncharacterized protein n=1 Tax=Psophocarpus tetragonolobus TaxID=3891 RepID=A0AAN9SE95_PSOTE
MGRSPCCDKVGLKKGPWTPEEDQKLLAYIEEHGLGSWRALPPKAGLQRCGKSCRLRWTNYLRPDIKRGKFSMQEEQTIIQLHALLGNRWSAIATHLAKRTDNEIKNYWNTHLKKRLDKMGIDPVTHKPKNDTLLTEGHSKSGANLTHMAQWESARLEAEARLARQSKLRTSHLNQSLIPTFATSSSAPSPTIPSSSRSHDQACKNTRVSDLESPTSTLSENNTNVKEEGEDNDCKWNKGYTPFGEYRNSIVTITMPTTWGSSATSAHAHAHADPEGFTNLLNTNSSHRLLSPEEGGESHNCHANRDSDLYGDNKIYWNNILNLMNYTSPSDSPIF